MNSLLASGLAVVFAWFAWRAWRESRVLAAGRAALLVQVHDVLGDVRETPLPSGYVKVTGTYRGLPVMLEPVVDTLNIRKLPVLWLMVTVVTPVPVRATFDLLMRASGTEVFSPYHGLEHSIDRPEGFPEWAGVRTDNPVGLPDAAIVSRYLSRFEDGEGKELLITPKGLRMVVMVDQADRGGYLIFRDARFGTAGVSAEVITGILDDLIALKADLAARGGVSG
jgi:hypothetical protein